MAALKRLGAMHVPARLPDGLEPRTLAGIRERVLGMVRLQYRVFHEELLPGLASHGIRIMLQKEEIEPWLDELFILYRDSIRPVLTPISVGGTHPFPNLVTGRLYLAVSLGVDEARTDQIEKSRLSFVEIPVRPRPASVWKRDASFPELQSTFLSIVRRCSVEGHG